MGLRISQRRGRTAVALATWPSPICTLSPGMSPVGIASSSSIAGAVTTSGSEGFTTASLTFRTAEHYRTWKVQIVRLEELGAGSQAEAGFPSGRWVGDLLSRLGTSGQAQRIGAVPCSVRRVLTLSLIHIS